MATTSYSPSETAPPTTHRSWTDLAATIFSFPVMCMFLLGAVIFGFCVKQIADPDIWWHLRNAAYLFQYHTFPSMDVFSFTAAGSPWMNFEWLSEVPYFLAFKAFGLRGVLMVYFVVLMLIYTGVYYRSIRAGADCKNATIVALLAIFLGVVSIGPRTLLFGWLCMVGLLLVLDHFQRTGKGLWLLPPLFTLWINLHGSWLFGLAVLGLTIGSGFVEGEWGLIVARRWSSGELKKLVVVSVVSVAALFVNPFGYKLVLYPFDFLFRQQAVREHIEEWRPVDFSSNDGKLALFMILALLAAALWSRRRWRLDEALLTGFALWAALSHVRFLFFLGLMMVTVLAPRLKLFPPYERELDKPWLNAGIMAAFVGALIFFFPSAAQLQQKVDQEYPRAALEFMQAQHINGRIFNYYGWGGYMEWNVPALKTFIDGRADIFVYKGILDEHLGAMRIKQSFETMDKYKIDYVLLPPDQPLSYLLEHSTAWHSIYNDKIAVLFGRTPASRASATGSKAQSN